MPYSPTQERTVSPDWWTQSRSLYCPVASGGGSALLAFGAHTNEWTPPWLPDLIDSFHELPKLLEQSRQLNSDVIYLNDYWEGGYPLKGDYAPRADLGGPEALRDGIRAIHDRGGRVIVYLEAFVVSRECDIGRAQGADWAMMHADGTFMHYPGLEAFNYYLMWPGHGSGFADYLAELGRRMVGEYGVDGFHLDSYGCQSGWRDHHPDHLDGALPGEFDIRAVDLVHTLRERIRSANPDAIVMMECCDRRDLLAVCDGAQDWSLGHLTGKPWAPDHRLFTAEFDLERMERALALGHNISLGNWWLRPNPTTDTLQRILGVDLPLDRIDIRDANAHWAIRAAVGDVWWCHSVLWANGLIQPNELGMGWLRRMVPPYPFPCDRSLLTEAGHKRWTEVRDEVVSRLEKSDLTALITPAEWLRVLIGRAKDGLLAV